MSPTNSQIDIVWQGEKLHLLARKGIFWPKEKTLFVADPHFGKAATFRKVGIPVSEHTTEDDCNRLLQMIESTEANKLVFLGISFMPGRERQDLSGHYFFNGERCVPMSKFCLFEAIMT